MPLYSERHTKKVSHESAVLLTIKLRNRYRYQKKHNHRFCGVE